MIDFIKKHWRLAGALAILVAAFFAGRVSVADKPAKVEVQEKVVYKDRIVTVEHQVKLQAEAKQVVVYRTRIVKPDGTQIEHEVEKTDTSKQATTTTAVAQTQKTDVQSEKQVTVINDRPQWRVGVLAGLDLSKVKLAPPTIGMPALGVEVSHRIIGGLSLGGWALTTGPSIGVSVSFEF